LTQSGGGKGRPAREVVEATTISLAGDTKEFHKRQGAVAAQRAANWTGANRQLEVKKKGEGSTSSKRNIEWKQWGEQAHKW